MLPLRCCRGPHSEFAVDAELTVSGQLGQRLGAGLNHRSVYHLLAVSVCPWLLLLLATGVSAHSRMRATDCRELSSPLLVNGECLIFASVIAIGSCML